MKTLLLTTAFFLILFCAQAQVKVGGGLAFGSEIETLGFDVRGNFDITDNIVIAPDITFFLNNTTSISGFDSKLKWWEININGNYVWNLNGFSPYVLTGLNLAFIGVEVSSASFGSFSDTSTEFGWNIGGGTKVPFNDKWEGFFELKYNISNADQLAVKGGVLVAIN